MPRRRRSSLESIGRAAAQPVGRRGEQAIGGLHGCLTRVEQEEAPGPIGRLHHAGIETGLPGQRRLLVANHSANGDLSIEEPGHRRSKGATIVPHVREERLGDAEEPAEVRVPSLCMDIVEHRARGIGGVGRVNRAACKLPEKEAVDRAERQLAPFSLGSRA